MKALRKPTNAWIILLILTVFLGTACGGATPAATPEQPEQPEPATQVPAAPTEAPQPTEPPPEGPMLPEEPIIILEWSGYEALDYPQFYAPFTAKYGEDLDQVVAYSIFADDSEAFAKIQSGFHVDVSHPCNNWWDLYVQNGMVQPIDTSRLSNWSGIHPDLAAMGAFNGQQYFVPWDWGYESILVRTDLVDKVPETWADLWDPAYAGHLAIWDVGETNFIVAALALGFDPWNTTPEQNEMVKQKLLELKPNVLTYWVDWTESYDLPAAGDVWVLNSAWQDAYGYLFDEGYEVEYVQPEEGRLGWVCGFGISSDARNLDIIYEFLDAAIAPESMAALANEYWYGAANTDALPLIDEFVVDVMDLDQIDNLTERTIFYQPLTEEQRQTMISIWDQVKAAP